MTKTMTVTFGGLDFPTPSMLTEARSWIADCVWGDMEPDDIAELTDDEIIRGVARHYYGGWEAFIDAGNY